MHFRLECRLDRYGWRCTLSLSLLFANPFTSTDERTGKETDRSKSILHRNLRNRKQNAKKILADNSCRKLEGKRKGKSSKKACAKTPSRRTRSKERMKNEGTAASVVSLSPLLSQGVPVATSSSCASVTG